MLNQATLPNHPAAVAGEIVHAQQQSSQQASAHFAGPSRAARSHLLGKVGQQETAAVLGQFHASSVTYSHNCLWHSERIEFVSSHAGS
jgi:hypothetical protein